MTLIFFFISIINWYELLLLLMLIIAYKNRSKFGYVLYKRLFSFNFRLNKSACELRNKVPFQKQIEKLE